MTQLDVYLKSDFEPDAEYVDGEIEERPRANTIMPHGRGQFFPGSASTAKNGTFASPRSCGFRSHRPGSGFRTWPCSIATWLLSRLQPNLQWPSLKFCRPKTQ
jgi:hypothetical protein